MSFFGFDTALPRDRAGQANDSGAGGLEDNANLDAKLRDLDIGAREDVEIYTWGGEGYDGLGDMLDEGGDELNDDTFGVAQVGKDFDFGATSALPPLSGSVQAQPKSKNDAAFVSTMDDFWGLPSRPTFSAPQQQQQQFAQPVPQQQQQQQPMQQQQAPRAAPRTLEEVEAEMRARSAQQQQPLQALPPHLQQQQSQPSTPNQQALPTQAAAGIPAMQMLQGMQLGGAAPSSSPGPGTPTQGRALTLEEVEAQMRARAAQAQVQAQQVPVQSQSPAPQLQQQLPPQQQAGPPGVDPRFAAPPQQQPHHQQQPSLSGFPPLPAQGPNTSTPAHLLAFPGGPGAFPPLGTPVGPRAGAPPQAQPLPGTLRGAMPPAAMAMHLAADNMAQARAAHVAKLHATLDALPPPVREAILRLPPHAQFASLEGVVRQFPALLRREDADAVIPVAMGRLEEVARMEMRNARRALKIQAMSRYNGLMSVSDKDFITRIQVSALVTSDPYADDFYAHIFFQLRGGANGGAGNPGLMGKPAGDAAPAVAPTGRAGAKGRKATRGRDQAMLRMQAQVERIVQNRKERSEKAAAGAALEGALGRVNPSNAKAPRQMLQVDARSATPSLEESGAGSAQDAVKAALRGASLAATVQPDGKLPALGRHVVLRILEKLYDTLLELEQLRRNVPAPTAPAAEGVVDEEHAAAVAQHAQEQAELVATLWSELRVLEPLEVSDPHPFISLLSSIKGKRILPRALRHLSQEQILTALTLIVASFDTLDVVRQAGVLDLPSEGLSDEARERRGDVMRQTEAFGHSIVPAMLSLMASAPLRIVSGMLALFVERNNLIRVAQTKPGIAFLTIFLSRAETLRQGGAAASGVAASTPEEQTQWSSIFNLLFSRLTVQGQLPTLFPSTRARAALPFGTGYYSSVGAVPGVGLGGELRNVDLEDEPVWNLMAALAVSATTAQHQILVQELREKILENVFAAKEWAARTGGAGGGADLRIRNVNLLLHALNLDAAQIDV